MAADAPNPELRTFIDSNEFAELDSDARISALSERDDQFAAMAESDPDGASRFVDAVTHMSRGEYSPSMMTSLEGGLERGVGWAAHAAAGLLRLVEDAGIVDDAPDEDVLAYANQRVDEGGKRIGSDWHHRLAGLTGSIGTAIVPGAALTGAAYAGGLALGASGVPLMVGAEAMGFGTAGFLQGLGESEGDYDQAALRGGVDTVLGGLGGWSSTLRRAVRFPLDLTAATVAQTTVLGMPLDQALTQAGVISIIAGLPGKRIPPQKIRALAPDAEDLPHGRALLADAELSQRARDVWIEEANRPLPEPIKSPDGTEYRTLAEFWEGQADALENTPVIHWHPQDRTPDMREKWANKEQHAARDTRELQFDEGDGPTPLSFGGKSTASKAILDDAGDAVGGIDVVKAGAGSPAGSLRVQSSDIVSSPARGHGYGTRAYMELADEAIANGGHLLSDAQVSTSAAKVYRRLEQGGYTVVRDPSAERVRGDLITDNDQPVFRVTNGPRRAGSLVDAEIPTGWNPGWRHPDTVAYGAVPDRVVEASGGSIKRPNDIIAPFAETFEFRVQRGNVRNAQGSQPLGYHWAPVREMKVLGRDDLQTVAHEWGHDIVVLEPELARYVQGKQLSDDVIRLRNWLAQEEATAGRPFTEPGVPSATLFAHKDNVPEDLKFIEELVALSYDRPNLREGFSEFVRAYLTNNKDFGGKTDLDVDAPHLKKIFEDWMEGLDRSKRDGLKTFATDSHAYVNQDAATAMIAMMGRDSSAEHILQSAASRARQALIDSNEGAWNAVRRSLEDPNNPKAAQDAADLAAAYLQSAQASGRLTDLAAWDAPPRLTFDKDGNPTQTLGPGESLVNLVQAVGPTHEYQNAFGSFINALRARELDNRVTIGGTRHWVDQFVNQKVVEARGRLKKARASGKQPSERDLKISTIWSNSKYKRFQKEDGILGLYGAKRTPVPFTRDAWEQALEIPNNPRYAHFPNVHSRLKGWQRQVRDYAQDAGMISKKQASDMDFWNAEYVHPWNRDMSDVVGGGPSSRVAGKGAGAREGGVVREAKGSQRALAGDWLELTHMGVDTLYRRAEENLAKRFVIDSIMNSPNAGLFFSMNEWIPKSRADLNRASVPEVIGDVPMSPMHNAVIWRDGKPFYYQVLDGVEGGDYGLLSTFANIHPPAAGMLAKGLNKVRTIQQDFVTMNPEFFVPAFARDLAGSFLFSKTKGNFMRKAVNGLYHGFRNSPEYREYVSLASSGGLTNRRASTPRALMAQARRADSRVSRVLTSPGEITNALRKTANVLEASTRFGEYQAARRQGAGAKHAAWLATQVQPHFNSRGTNANFRSFINTAKFLPATLNAADRLFRGVLRDNHGRSRLITKLGMMAMSGVALDEMNRRIIPNWSEIPEWLKWSNFIIPIPEFDGEQGGFQLDDQGNLKVELQLVPKNHEIGLVSNMATRLMDEMYADTSEGPARAAFEMSSILLASFGFNVSGEGFPMPTPVVFGDAAEAVFDRNFFTWNPIEGTEMTGLTAWNRTNERTPEMWRQYGAMTKHAPWLPDMLESPTMAQHLFESMFATFGIQAGVLSEQLGNPYAMSLSPEDTPIFRRFRVRADARSTVEREFYDTTNDLQKLSNDLSKWSKEGDSERIAEAFNDPEWARDHARGKAFAQTRQMVQSINAAIERIQGAKMDGAKKRTEYERLVKARRDIMRRVSEQWGVEP